ncbi:MAG: iron-containing alcohol dehydrogenase, partial [Oscillospiraceae bacterium]|nr:iron-containing alcohol dehydrogenase [Oscillospiraceae bacterium]
SKYIALIDWQVSHLLTGEYYCERVAALTRKAADDIFAMAEHVTENDEQTAAIIFESLLLTGIAMSFTKNSRPGSGTEHILAHFWECIELLDGKIPNYHGEDVGVATLMMLRYYEELAKLESITAHKDEPDWGAVYAAYGALADDVRKINLPDNITDAIDPKRLEDCWEQIVQIIKSVPSYDACRTAMEKAGCKLTTEQIGKSRELVETSFAMHTFMRRRLSLYRASRMIDGLQCSNFVL